MMVDMIRTTEDLLALLTDTGSGAQSMRDIIVSLDASDMHYNAKRLGVVGDGVTDDTAAIQAILDLIAASDYGGSIFFPAGTYLVDEGRLSYESTKPVTLYGEGKWASRFVWVPATDVPVWDGTTDASWFWGMVNIGGVDDDEVDHCTRVEIRDLGFNFGATDRFDAWNPTQRGLNVTRADNIHITRCHFSNCRAEMVGFGNFGSASTPGRNAWVTDCTFEENVQDAINPNVFNCTIRGCDFRRGYGMFIEAGRSRFKVSDCDFEDGYAAAIQLSSVDRFTVSNNTIIDCASNNWGSVVGAINLVDGGASAGSYRGTIVGNTIQNTSNHTWHAGIAFGGATEEKRCKKVEVSANVVEGAWHSIYVASGDLIHVHGCTISTAKNGVEFANSTLVTNCLAERNVYDDHLTMAVPWENLGDASRNNQIRETLRGQGSPEGSVAGLVGMEYINLDGESTDDAARYIKVGGTGNTGWKAVAVA